MPKKTDARPGKAQFEKVDAPTEPLSVRASQREAQREDLRRTALAKGLSNAFGKAKADLVARFLRTGHVEAIAPRLRIKPRLVQNTKGEEVRSTEIALWVFDLRLHGGLALMEAYRETARHYKLSVKQVMDSFKDHRAELERHQLLFKFQ
jgi:hypothetical protein